MSHSALICRYKTPESPQSSLPHSCINKYFEPHRGATRKATLAPTLHPHNFECFNWFPLQWHRDFECQRSPLASLAHPDPHPPPHRRPDPGQMRQRAGLHDIIRRSIMDEGKVCALLYVATCQCIICPTPCSLYGILLKPRWGLRRAHCRTGHRSMEATVYRGSVPCNGLPVCNSSCVPLGVTHCCSGQKLTPLVHIHPFLITMPAITKPSFRAL